MTQHPAFLIVRAKLAEAGKALEHMNSVHAHQCALRDKHPGGDEYSQDVHAESIVTNVQGIYTQCEGILKGLADTIDGFSPTGDAWHRDLLLQAASEDADRPAMIGSTTLMAMTELLAFRHAVRHNYATALRHDDVFKNLATLQALAPAFVSDIEHFIEQFGTSTPPPPAHRG